MENLPEYIQSLLLHPAVQQLASSPLALSFANIQATYLNPSLAHLRESYLDPTVAHLRLTYLDPYVVQPLAHLLSTMPDVASVLVLFFVLFVSFKILDYTRRAVMWWLWTTIWAAKWATIFGAVGYVYIVGWEKVVHDVAYIFNFLSGLLEQHGHGLESTARVGHRPSGGQWRMNEL
ncbi:nuclear pore assembly and biogenesis-domain-containing protein [Aspergillus falconensis]